jgi:hypothetical protein
MMARQSRRLTLAACLFMASGCASAASGTHEPGIPLWDMSVVVRDTRSEQYHAVLSVAATDGYLILDSLSDMVPKASALYAALFSWCRRGLDSLFQNRR